MSVSVAPQVSPTAVIYPTARIVRPENLWVGEQSAIDDFVFLNAGACTRIGRYVHIACHVSVIGGGELHVGDYISIATGARLITGTDTFEDGARMSSALPLEYRNVRRSKVVLGDDSFVGANAVVMPGVTIGEGAVAGAGCVVTSDLEPWTVYAGVPARPVKARPRPTRAGP